MKYLNKVSVLILLLLLSSIIAFCQSSPHEKKSPTRNKMAQYYVTKFNDYIYKNKNDSVFVTRRINAKQYKKDTLIQYFDLQWDTSAVITASIMTAAFKVGNYWQCNDYYFKTKNPFRWGFFEDQELTKPVGPFKIYFKDGQLAERGYYKDRKKSGKWEWFNSNGNLTNITTYRKGISVGYCFFVEDKDTVFSYLDSLGQGYSFQKFANGTTVLLGKYLAGGIKDSIWVQYDDSARVWYTQKFVQEKIVQEICYDTNGNITTDTAAEDPVFKRKGNNDIKISNYLSRHIFFPSDLRLNIPTGRVFYEFVVEKDGSVGEIKIRQSLESHFDDAVIRALKQMPKWKKPARFHGRAVKSYLQGNINFNND